MGNKALILDASTKRMEEESMTDSVIRKAFSVIGREIHQTGFTNRAKHSAVHTKDIDCINATISLPWQK
jgi:hypothetical protein